MASLVPEVNFAELSEEDMTVMSLDLVEATFNFMDGRKLTNNDSFAAVMGVVRIDGLWIWQGERLIGPDAKDFVGNIDFETGKLATALRYHMDSVDAYHEFRLVVPEGAQRYTGGVFHRARVETADKGWLSQDIAGAGSAVQGHLDMTAMKAGITLRGGLWALQQQARYGKPS